MIQQTAVIIYDVVNRGNKQVELKLLIGEGQLGQSLVLLGGKKIANRKGSFSLPLGSNKELKGSRLMISSTIVDINKATDKVSMSIALHGGKKIHEQSIIDSTVSNHGDMASALVSIIFI